MTSKIKLAALIVDNHNFTTNNARLPEDVSPKHYHRATELLHRFHVALVPHSKSPDFVSKCFHLKISVNVVIPDVGLHEACLLYTSRCV